MKLKSAGFNEAYLANFLQSRLLQTGNTVLEVSQVGFLNRFSIVVILLVLSCNGSERIL